MNLFMTDSVCMFVIMGSSYKAKDQTNDVHITSILNVDTI